MIEWLRKRPPIVRVLVYAAAAILVFAVAAGVGAVGALMLRGDLGVPRAEQPQPSDEQGNAPRPQQEDAAAQQDEAGGQQDAAPAAQQKDAAAKQQQQQQQQQEAAAQQSEADYLANISEIQSNAVETFLDTHDKLLRYDALTADDLKKMDANRATLQELSAELANLDPPQRYAAHYEVFGSAIGELEEAVGLAYEVVADPTSATKAEFDEYDRHAREAGGGLRRSNEMLGRDYKTLEGVREISPL
jgi:hypothetical protein